MLQDDDYMPELEVKLREGHQLPPEWDKYNPKRKYSDDVADTFEQLARDFPDSSQQRPRTNEGYDRIYILRVPEGLENQIQDELTNHEAVEKVQRKYRKDGRFPHPHGIETELQPS